MAYDLLIRNGRIVDGSGMPSFRGDVAVKGGKIAEIGKLTGPANRTIDAEARVVAPGFIDNHCHYDAQVTWDPLCTYSCDHGATSVIFGNCSLSLAPVRKGNEGRLAEFLSYVEAIPMEVLRTVEFGWETVPQYLDQLDHHLGVNVGNLVGHTAVRYYVMGDDCQKRTASDDEIKEMQGLVRDGIKAGALGLSVSRNQGHYDPQGVHIPALWADEKEIFALGDVLRELGTGLIQSGGGNGAEVKNGLMSRLSEATGRTVVYNNLLQSMRRPSEWKEQMALIDASTAKGIRAFPMCTPNRIVDHFTMRNCQEFRGLPTWHPILLASDEEKLRAYSDPEIRKKFHAEAVEFKVDTPPPGICRTWWDYMTVQTAVLPKNKVFEGKTVGELAKMQGKGIIDAFLDLVVEENLDTEFLHGEINVDEAAMARILTYPERHHRSVGRRGACAIPERLRLQHPAALGVGARQRDHVAGTGGAAADFRIRPRSSGSTTAACCGPGWRPTSRSSTPTRCDRCRSRSCTTSRPAPSASRSRPRASWQRSSTARCCWRTASIPGHSPDASSATPTTTPTAADAPGQSPPRQVSTSEQQPATSRR